MINKGENSGGAPGRARIEGGVVKGDAYITGAAAKATAQAETPPRLSPGLSQAKTRGEEGRGA